MSDLISRSGLYMNDLIRRKDVLALFPTNDCSDKMVGLYERVLDIPTAYDVEKVVAELEEETECPNCSMYCADAHICGFDEMRKQAIDIVKRGGVE